MTVASRIWRGDAVAVKQVMTITPGTVSASTTYGIQINGKTVEATGATAAALCEAFVTAINGSPIPEFREIIASTADGVLTLTSKTSGVPFAVKALVAGFTQGAAIVVTISNQPSGGTFSYTAYDANGIATGTETPAYNASAATVQTSMDTLYGSGNTLVTKTFDAEGNWSYEILFQGTLANTAVPVVAVSGASLTGGNAALEVSVTQTAVAGTDCVQTSTHLGTGTGGTRTFTFDGFTTSDLAFDATTGTVQTAMRALLSINGANVTVSGTANSSYVFTFSGDLAHRELPLIECDETNITGGSIGASLSISEGASGTNQIYYLERMPTDETYTTERSQVIITRTTASGWSAGTWTFDSSVAGFSAVTIPFDATPSEIAALIEAEVETTGSVVVVATLTRYYVYFYGTESQFTLGTITIGSAITGGSVALSSQNQGDNNSASVIPSTTFKFAYGGASSSAVAINASDADMQAAIEAMAFCGTGNVTVTELNDDVSTYVKKIEFRGALGGRYVGFGVTEVVDADGTMNLQQYQLGAATGANEAVTLTIAGTPSTGSLILEQSGNETAAIAYNETAAGVAAKVGAMSHVGAANVVGTGGPLPGTPVVITFINGLSQTDVPLMTVNDNALRCSVAQTTPGVTGANEIQKLDLSGQDIWAGTVTLTVDSVAFDALDWDSTYLELQAEIDGELGTGKATASGGPWPEFPIYIEFDGDNAETNMDLITATDDLKNGLAEAVSHDPLIVSLTTRATGPNHWNNGVNWVNPASSTDFKPPCPGDSVYVSEGRGDILYGLAQVVDFTVDQTNDYLIPATSHDFLDGQEIEVWHTGGGLPTGLSGSTTYYVRDLDAFTGKFRLSATLDGTAVNISSAGSGTLTAGVRLELLKLAAKSTSKIGLPWLSASNYREYREQYLKIGTTPAGVKKVIIGEGDGQGAGRVCINTGTDQAVIECLATGSPIDSGLPAARWKGAHASNVVKLRGGELGIACLTGETATGDQVEQTGGTLTVGTVTFATYDKTGGDLIRVDRGSFSGVVSIRG